MIRQFYRWFGSAAAGETTITSHVYSERGGAHADNEDAVESRRHDRDGALWLCCLADGQGGQPGGARAAQIAVQSAITAALAVSPRALLKPKICEGIVRAADNAVYADPEAGFATLVVLTIRDRRVCGASCGDSAAVLLQDGERVVLTQEQLANPPIGSRAARPRSFYLDLEPPWRICALSDGIWKYAGWDRIVALMRRKGGSDLVDALRAAAIRPGTDRLPDDFSIASFACDTVDR
ncbi:MAG TPA: PP2C family serine/threonine-protein phosphatase [Roseiflexaceae bacterium]|nr:PP2C family serine/threonine-protein phosphatase [Roseiflexaceae bacterium]